MQHPSNKSDCKVKMRRPGSPAEAEGTRTRSGQRRLLVPFHLLRCTCGSAPPHLKAIFYIKEGKLHADKSQKKFSTETVVLPLAVRIECLQGFHHKAMKAKSQHIRDA